MSEDPLITLHKESLCYYLKNLIALALPNTFTVLLWVTQSMISLYFVGLLNNVTYLDAYSLALSWSYIFAFSIIGGLASAMDTLVPQSFGAGEYPKCAVHLYRGLLVVFTASLPCYFFMYMSGPALNFIGVDKEVATHSHRAALSMIPMVALYVPQTLLEKFMLGQRIAKPQMVIQGVNTLLHPIYCHIFIFWMDLSYMGAMLARAFSTLIYLIGMVLYLYLSGCCEKSLVLPSKSEVFSNWGNYLYLALPTMLMVCLEYCSCVGLSILCAKLGVVDLAAHAISCNYGDLIFATCLGMGCSISTLVGNSIGEENIANGKRYAFIGIAFIFITISLFQVPVLAFRVPLIEFFTKDPQVVRKLSTLLFLVSFREIFDGTQCALGRTLIGMGKQDVACKINLAVYYAFMLPIAIFLGYFVKLGVTGVWIATCLAAVTVTLAFIGIIWRQDWKALLIESQKRISQG